MICSRCKKRPAAVFITTMNGNEKRNEGLCLICARELGISQVDEYMKQMGITDEDLESFAESMMTDADGDSFEMGGSNTMPNIISNILGKLGGPAAPSSGAQPQENAKAKKEEKAPKKKELKFLNTYCTNLNDRAQQGKLDNIVGREREIGRVIQILSRRQKNNPCLIGEPGVGKTAIAEGIAQKIVSGDVPFSLKNKQIWLLDLTALVAGTQFRGQFESRIKGLIEEVKREGNVILFIDEVHTLVGTGDNEGTMNAANILKPSLSRGEVQVIGATTFKEYRKHIEKDSALERRFQPVTVCEPTVEDTVKVLVGIKKYYEEYHHVKISDAALRMCAVLSERYINDRFLPDKAIDLLDESCALASIGSPEIAKAQELKTKLENECIELSELEEAENPDYEKIAEQKAKISQTENEYNKASEEADKVYVTDAELSKVIELWTGIPANKIVESEYEKIRGLHKALSEKIIGQPEAVDLVCAAIKRSRVQLTSRRRPASFIFVGPTGVGKTELAKTLAAELFDATEPLVRIDMSEYMEKHSVSRLIGSPPGYIGYDEAGQLTEKVRRKPYSVVLFDEIEKAHPDVFNTLLQVLDDGRLTDNKGRMVNFKNTIIIMTSNATREQLSKLMRPEFLNRIDDIITFKPLEKSEIAQVVELQMNRVKKMLEPQGFDLEWTPQAIEYLADKGYDPQFGARPVKRAIQDYVLNELSKKLLSEEVSREKPIIIDNFGDGLVFRN